MEFNLELWYEAKAQSYNGYLAKKNRFGAK